MRLVHFVLQGRLVGGVERLLADVLAADCPGLEHAVVMHAQSRCELAGRWPVHAASWSAEEAADVNAVARAIHDLDGLPLFHFPPHPEVLNALRGSSFAVFCHAHDWWCGSGSRYYSRIGRACGIRGSTLQCALRWQAFGCGSLRPGNVRRGLSRAASGRSALAAAHRVLVLSEFMGNEAQRHGAHEDAVRVIPAPTSLAGSPVPAPPDTPTLLYASRLTAEKGIGTLLQAFAQSRGDITLEIAGAGIAAKRVARRVASHPARDRIRLLGHVERPALLAALARASAVVVPSAWPEPFGIVGIEALALGRPVIATNVGGMTEWATEDLGVLHVPPGRPAELAEAMRRVLEEPVWRHYASVAGAAWVARRHAPHQSATALQAALS